MCKPGLSVGDEVNSYCGIKKPAILRCFFWGSGSGEGRKMGKSGVALGTRSSWVLCTSRAQSQLRTMPDMFLKQVRSISHGSSLSGYARALPPTPTPPPQTFYSGPQAHSWHCLKLLCWLHFLRQKGGCKEMAIFAGPAWAGLAVTAGPHACHSPQQAHLLNIGCCWHVQAVRPPAALLL